MRVWLDHGVYFTRCMLFGGLLFLGQRFGLGADLVLAVPALSVTSLKHIGVSALMLWVFGSFFYPVVSHVWNRVVLWWNDKRETPKPAGDHAWPNLVCGLIATGLAFGVLGALGIMSPKIPLSLIPSYVFFVILADLPGQILYTYSEKRFLRDPERPKAVLEDYKYEQTRPVFRRIMAALVSTLVGIVVLTLGLGTMLSVLTGQVSWSFFKIGFWCSAMLLLIIPFSVQALLKSGHFWIRRFQMTVKTPRGEIAWAYFLGLAAWIVPLAFLSVIYSLSQGHAVMGYLGAGVLMLIQSAVSALVYAKLVPLEHDEQFAEAFA